MAAEPMAWKKRGLVDLAPAPADWCATHAALPAIDDTDPKAPLLYISSRDRDGRSRIGRGPLAIADGKARCALEAAPVIDLGALGAFDDSGVTNSCIVADGSRRFLYYTGWTKGVTVPFYLFAGLALSEDNGRTFARCSEAPLLERSGVDPFLTASPWVMKDAGSWRMWYVSANAWSSTPAGPRHHYHIRYAESADGVTWKRAGRVCIDFAGAGEHAFGRPCVIRDGGRYRMWYSVRGDQYRIGYAESSDGLEWTRLDRLAGIDVSADGWDSQMIEYPLVADLGGRRLMLYNGNDYGRTGVGLAELE